jgi:hypothetical protein
VTRSVGVARSGNLGVRFCRWLWEHRARAQGSSRTHSGARRRARGKLRIPALAPHSQFGSRPSTSAIESRSHERSAERTAGEGDKGLAGGRQDELAVASARTLTAQAGGGACCSTGSGASSSRMVTTRVRSGYDRYSSRQRAGGTLGDRGGMGGKRVAPEHGPPAPADCERVMQADPDL